MKGRITVADGHQEARRPDPFVIEGSNDGSTWDEIARFTETGPFDVGDYKEFRILTNRSYRHFRFVWENNGSGIPEDGAEIGWIRALGYLDYDADVDVTYGGNKITYRGQGVTHA